MPVLYVPQRHGGAAWIRDEEPTGVTPDTARVHLALLFLNGVTFDGAHGMRFSCVAPTRRGLTQLTQTIAERVGSLLDRQGMVGMLC